MFEQPLILAIDSGGSKSDFILLTPDGQETARSRGKGVAALHVGMLPVEEYLRNGLQTLEQYTPQIALVYCSLGGPNTEEVHMALQRIFPIADIRIGREADGDMVLSAAAQWKAKAAILCGTGSTAVGEIGGMRVFAGGWGPLLGDEGSGGGVGCDALRMLLHAVDAGEGAACLPGIYPELGRISGNFTDRMALKKVANQITRAEMAAQVPVIAELAEAGDKNALLLMKKAAAGIAFLASAVTPEMPEEPQESGILALGGFFKCGEFFRKLCREELQKTRKNHHFIFNAVNMIDVAAAFAIKTYNRSTKK